MLKQPFSLRHMALLTLAISSSFGVSLAEAQSIKSLPQLSKMLIHHYECRLGFFNSAGVTKDIKFQMMPTQSGHDSSSRTLVVGADKIVAATNTQMLQIEWTRSNQGVAMSQASIQNSPSSSFVLIVQDPRDEETQVHLNCDGVSYSALKSAGQP